jgi:hypothetical protein
MEVSGMPGAAAGSGGVDRASGFGELQPAAACRPALTSEDIMLHALTATIGTLAVLASLKLKLDFYRRAHAAAGVAPPTARPLGRGGH